MNKDGFGGGFALLFFWVLAIFLGWWVVGAMVGVAVRAAMWVIAL